MKDPIFYGCVRSNTVPDTERLRLVEEAVAVETAANGPNAGRSLREQGDTLFTSYRTLALVRRGEELVAFGAYALWQAYGHAVVHIPHVLAHADAHTAKSRCEW